MVYFDQSDPTLFGQFSNENNPTKINSFYSLHSEYGNKKSLKHKFDDISKKIEEKR